MHNPFAAADKVQADGSRQYIPAGSHHFKILELTLFPSQNPTAPKGTLIFNASLLCLNSALPPLPDGSRAEGVGLAVVGRNYSRTLVLPLIHPHSPKDDVDTSERSVGEAKAIIMAACGVQSHDEAGFTAQCAQLGMSQGDLMFKACGADNPLANTEVFCEGQTIKKRDGSPFTKTVWYPKG